MDSSSHESNTSARKSVFDNDVRFLCRAPVKLTLSCIVWFSTCCNILQSSMHHHSATTYLKMKYEVTRNDKINEAHWNCIEHLQIFKDCKAMMQAERAQSDGT